MNCEDVAILSSLYLSGELDTPRALEIAEHLRGCHVCASELEQQIQFDAVLRSSVLSEAIDSAGLDRHVREHIASERPSSFVHRLSLAAGIAAMLLAGILGYRILFAPGLPRLCADAAQDHRIEVTSRQHRMWLSDPKAIGDLAQRNGLPASLIASLAPAGYRLEHAKLCRLDGRVFLHLVYAQGNSEFSTYIRPLDALPLRGAIRETASGKLLHEADTGHEHIAYFQTGQLTAMFVTDQSRDAVLSIARSAARVL